MTLLAKHLDAQRHHELAKRKTVIAHSLITGPLKMKSCSKSSFGV